MIDNESLLVSVKWDHGNVTIHVFVLDGLSLIFIINGKAKTNQLNHHVKSPSIIKCFVTFPFVGFSIPDSANSIPKKLIRFM